MAKRTKKAAAKTSARKPGAKTGTKSETADLIDMEEAIALLKTSRPTFYRWLKSGAIHGVKLGRKWRFDRADIERFRRGEAPRLDLPVSVDPFIEQLRARLDDLGQRPGDIDGATPIERAASLMVLLGVHLGASDFHLATHLDPDSGEHIASLRYRIDGVLHEVARPDTRLVPGLVTQWKRMAACNPEEHLRSQDGRVFLNVAGPNGEKLRVDVRINFLASALGETFTARMLSRDWMIQDLDELGLFPTEVSRVRAALDAPWGGILVTGPTGSGKTTTMYACLSQIASPERKVMTAEDPVELLLPWAIQTPLREQAGMGYEATARAILRSAPNTIMIGEMRNAETARIVAQASLTGHLVISALHAAGTVEALTRLVDMGINPFVVGDGIRLVIAQRLMRTLCPECRKRAKPDAGRMRWAREQAARGGATLTDKTSFCQPVGCPKCLNTGYRGRTIVAEVLEVSDAVAAALRTGRSADEIRRVAVEEGMTTLLADAIRRAAEGTLSIDDVAGRLGE